MTYATETIAVRETLSSMSQRIGKPFVVFFDEADCLFGQILISFLRQLRDGFCFLVAIIAMLGWDALCRKRAKKSA